MRRTVPALLALAIALTANLHAELVPVVEPASVVAFGTGEVTVSASVPKANALVLSFKTSLPEIGALLLDTATGEHLALVTALQGEELAAPYLRAPVRGSLKVEAADLKDTSARIAIPMATPIGGPLRLTLIRNDGLAVPFAIRGNTSRGFSVSLVFEEGCIWYQGTCAVYPPCPACTTERIECCEIPRGACVYCSMTCSIACEPCIPDTGGCP